MPLNILIVGAGIAGPAAATFLQGSNPEHKITVIERCPSLRLTGQQIDLKNQGVDVAKKMGLLETIKSRCVDERGLEVLNAKGERMAVFGVSPSDKQGRTLTSEYEIMRGDLVQVLYDASLKQNARLQAGLNKDRGLTYEFGKTLTDLAQDDDGVNVTFSTGETKRYDLVVGADGQSSRTRRLAFGVEASEAAFKSLGVHAAYFSVPRIESEGEFAKLYNAPGRKMMLTRTSGRPVTQVLFFSKKNGEQLQKSYRESIEKQKEVFAEEIKDVNWQTDRFLRELRTSDNFYAHELCQIKMEKLYKGRVVLIGDAGYCPTPFTGMGNTGCLVGAYVLAGELARNKNNVPQALKAYEEVVRPPIKEIQTLPERTLSAVFPSSQLGTWVLRNVLWAVSKIDQLVDWPQREDTKKWKLPEYPELNLGS